MANDCFYPKGSPIQVVMDAIEERLKSLLDPAEQKRFDEHKEYCLKVKALMEANGAMAIVDMAIAEGMNPLRISMAIGDSVTRAFEENVTPEKAAQFLQETLQTNYMEIEKVRALMNPQNVSKPN